MASRVDVDITDFAIIKALNTPGGAAYEWRDGQAQKIMEHAILHAPVNDPANAVHRGGVVGRYKASFAWDKVGSNGHHVQARIFNTADHAEFVEFGRSASRKRQTFSWTQWGGQIHTIGGKGKFAGQTSGRPGEHILRDAANAVMRGTATPLV